MGSVLFFQWQCLSCLHVLSGWFGRGADESTYTYVHTYMFAVIESFKSVFTLNIDWPSDPRYDISIHGETVVNFRSA